MMTATGKRKINEGQAKALIEAFLNARISEKQLIDLIIENAQIELPNGNTVNELERLTRMMRP